MVLLWIDSRMNSVLIFSLYCSFFFLFFIIIWFLSSRFFILSIFMSITLIAFCSNSFNLCLFEDTGERNISYEPCLVLGLMSGVESKMWFTWISSWLLFLSSLLEDFRSLPEGEKLFLLEFSLLDIIRLLSSVSKIPDFVSMVIDCLIRFRFSSSIILVRSSWTACQRLSILLRWRLKRI